MPAGPITVAPWRSDRTRVNPIPGCVHRAGISCGQRARTRSSVTRPSSRGKVTRPEAA